MSVYIIPCKLLTLSMHLVYIQINLQYTLKITVQCSLHLHVHLVMADTFRVVVVCGFLESSHQITPDHILNTCQQHAWRNSVFGPHHATVL